MCCLNLSIPVKVFPQMSQGAAGWLYTYFFTSFLTWVPSDVCDIIWRFLERILIIFPQYGHISFFCSGLCISSRWALRSSIVSNVMSHSLQDKDIFFLGCLIFVFAGFFSSSRPGGLLCIRSRCSFRRRNPA